MTYVTNDILCALDRRDSVFAVLIDLPAAFDTVNHKLLLSRREGRVGLGRQVLSWATSYLSARYQYISVSASSSEPKPLVAMGMGNTPQSVGTILVPHGSLFRDIS